MDRLPETSRRQFLQRSAALTAAVASGALGAQLAASPAVVAPAPTPAAPPVPTPFGSFPPGFRWGAATASYQIEGAVSEDGRLPSIWDTFSHTAGKVVNGDHADVACDYYHRFPEDIRLMADLGVKHYRFSISWSRVIPSGRGAVNEKGVDFYRRVCDQLASHGITPHVTLYHWDLPQALQDAYRGWEDDRILGDFAEYAATMARLLGDRVQNWMTLNEIQSFAARAGYNSGRPAKHAPGIDLASKQIHRQLVHRTLLAHGMAVQALRAHSPKPCQVGMAENYSSLVPLIETPEHIAAARKAFLEDEYNGGILLPLLTGHYNEAWLAERRDTAPRFNDADMRTIGQPLDFLGFNCYSGGYVKASESASGYERLPLPPAYPKMNISWLNVVPESIYWGIRLVSEAVGATKLPIIISENGCPDAKPEGEFDDADRIMYLRAYLRNVQRAAVEGYPVVGYFPWSFMDNFEWAEGYAKRFGLVHVDFATQKRTPKASADWYREVVRANHIL